MFRFFFFSAFVAVLFSGCVHQKTVPPVRVPPQSPMARLATTSRVLEAPHGSGCFLATVDRVELDDGRHRFYFRRGESVGRRMATRDHELVAALQTDLGRQLMQALRLAGFHLRSYPHIEPGTPASEVQSLEAGCDYLVRATVAFGGINRNRNEGSGRVCDSEALGFSPGHHIWCRFDDLYQGLRADLSLEVQRRSRIAWTWDAPDPAQIYQASGLGLEESASFRAGHGVAVTNIAVPDYFGLATIDAFCKMAPLGVCHPTGG